MIRCLCVIGNVFSQRMHFNPPPGRSPAGAGYRNMHWFRCGLVVRLIASCITQLKAQGPARTCNESQEEEEIFLEEVLLWVLEPRWNRSRCSNFVVAQFCNSFLEEVLAAYQPNEHAVYMCFFFGAPRRTGPGGILCWNKPLPRTTRGGPGPFYQPYQ